MSKDMLYSSQTNVGFAANISFKSPYSPIEQCVFAKLPPRSTTLKLPPAALESPRSQFNG